MFFQEFLVRSHQNKRITSSVLLKFLAGEGENSALVCSLLAPTPLQSLSP